MAEENVKIETQSGEQSKQTSEEHEKIVMLSVDQSEQSKQAFEWYFENLHRKGNKIICVHAVEAPSTAEEAWDVTGVGKKRLSAVKHKWEKCQAEAEQLAATYHEMLSAHHTKAQLQLLGGTPGETIVKAAHENKVDMIIMGSRGLNRLRRTILGSVSDYVLHHAHCPVCIHHPHKK